MNRRDLQKEVSQIAEEEFQAKEQKMMPGKDAREKMKQYVSKETMKTTETTKRRDATCRNRKLHFAQFLKRMDSEKKDEETCFVFDMDGTLLDLEPLHFKAWREAVRDTRIVLSEEFFNGMIGIPTRDCAEMICSHIKNELNISIDPENLMKRKSSMFFKVAKDARAFKGVEESLRLVKQSGFKIGFCTGSTREIADTMLSKCGIATYFPSYLRVTADDFKNGKPRPQPYRLAAKRCCMRVEQCIAFEDSPAGCKSASSAGFKYVLGVLTSYDKKSLRNAGATRVFKSTKDAVLWALKKFNNSLKKTLDVPKHLKSSPKRLVVCDFDWSLVNENSDTYVLDVLDSSLRDYMKTLRKDKPEKYVLCRSIFAMIQQLLQQQQQVRKRLLDSSDGSLCGKIVCIW